MTSCKYIGMDVHKETISIAVISAAGKLQMESVIETKANTVLQFIHGLRGDLQVTFEEGTWAASAVPKNAIDSRALAPEGPALIAPKHL